MKLQNLHHLRNRINSWFTPAFSAYVFSQPPNTVVPAASEVMLMPEWRAVLCRTPWEDDLSADIVADAVEKMPAFIEETMRTRTEYLLELMRQSKSYAGREVTVDHLSLASTFFRCNECGIVMLEKPYDLATFPAILAHSCSILELDGKGSGSLERGSFFLGPSVERSGQRLPAPILPVNDDDDLLLRFLREEQRVVDTEAKPGRFWRDVAKITFDDVAYEHMNLMLDALGLDRTTTMLQMEQAQPYVEGICQCFTLGNYQRRREGRRWLNAVSALYRFRKIRSDWCPVTDLSMQPPQTC